VWLYLTWSNRVSGAHVWRRNPPCARHRNEESLLNSLHCAVRIFLPDLRISTHETRQAKPLARVLSSNSGCTRVFSPRCHSLGTNTYHTGQRKAVNQGWHNSPAEQNPTYEWDPQRNADISSRFGRWGRDALAPQATESIFFPLPKKKKNNLRKAA